MPSKLQPTRTITIVCGGSGYGLFAVHEGEAYTTHLCWDEMLGQIASMTHPQINAPHFTLETPDEREAHRARWSKPDPNVVDASIDEPATTPETP